MGMLNQATLHGDTTFVPWTMLLPRRRERLGGGRAHAACCEAFHPHPSPPRLRGKVAAPPATASAEGAQFNVPLPCADTVAPEGSLWAHFMWSDIEETG